MIPGTEGVVPGPGLKLDQASIEFAKLNSADLSNASFTSAKLTSASFHSANLNGASFKGAILNEAVLTFASLQETDLSDAEIRGAVFYDTTSRGLTSSQLYSTASYKNGDLSGIQLTRNDLFGWNLSGKKLVGAQLWKSNLAGVNLSNSDLRDAALYESDLAGADLTDAVLEGARLYNATQHGFTREQLYSTASYKQGNLRQIHLEGTVLDGWDLSGQDLAGAQLADVRNADLSKADLTGSRIQGPFANANLSDAVIEYAQLSGSTRNGLTPEQFYATKSYQVGSLRGVQFGGGDFGMKDTDDLSGWRFNGKDLTGAELRVCKLDGADFTDAKLGSVVFDLSGLVGASFSRAELFSARFVQANLAGADLSNADLRDAFFFGANTEGADFSLADLRGVQGFTPAGSAVLRNAIRPDGQLPGASLLPGDVLRIADADVAIRVADGLSMEPGSKIAMILSDTNFGSRVSVDAGGPVSLSGGTLELVFGEGSSLESLVGHPLHIFDWGTAPTSQFSNVAVPAGSEWDFSRLYDRGEVTLTAVPEPSAISLGLGAMGALLVAASRPKPRPLSA